MCGMVLQTCLNPFKDQVSKHMKPLSDACVWEVKLFFFMKPWWDACVWDGITNKQLNPSIDQVSKHMKPWSEA